MVQNLKTVLQILDQEGITLKKLKTRQQLANSFEALKHLVVENDSKTERIAVDKIRLGAWRITSNVDYLQVKDDLGVPRNMTELRSFVSENRLARFGVNNTAKDYLEYITQDDTYALETRDWVKYSTGKDSDPVVTTQSSKFFHVPHGSKDQPPCEIYRLSLIHI